MDKINYNVDSDRLVHVGDLVAKGTKNEVLTWMNERHIQGVRGNHDQPVSVLSYDTGLVTDLLGSAMADLDGVGRRGRLAG